MSAFLDIATLVIVVVFTVRGARNGLIKEVFRLAALGGGFLVAFLFYRDLQGVIAGSDSGLPAMGVAVTAFLIIYLAVFFAILGIGHLLRKITEAVSLGGIDKVLGLTLGLTKALIIAWAACLSISSFPVQKVEKQFDGSFVYKTFKRLPESFSLASLEDFRAGVLGRRPAQERGDKKYDGSGEET